MAAELIYTSAVRGLHPGTSGFCTVAMSRSLPGALADRLEALSGFRPLLGVTEQPIAASHWILEVSGAERHVLSTVRAAAPDHTHRSNKLAHHVVLKDSELVQAGPAWLLLHGGIAVREWTAEPAWLDSERVIPDPGPVAATKCAAWEQWAGDPGWAGVLVNQAILDRSRSVAVVYPPGAPALQLIVEAMAIMPASLRWRIPFTSFAMEQQAGVRISWRFCLEGTPSAAAARRAGNTIDLCARSVLSQHGRCIEAAREGRVVSESDQFTPPIPTAAAPATSRASRPLSSEPIRLAADEPTPNLSHAAPLQPRRAPESSAPAESHAKPAVPRLGGPWWQSRFVQGGLAVAAILAICIGTTMGALWWNADRALATARAAMTAAEKKYQSADEAALTLAAGIQQELTRRTAAEQAAVTLRQERDTEREQRQIAQQEAARLSAELAQANRDLAAVQSKHASASQPNPAPQTPAGQSPVDHSAILLGSVPPPGHKSGDLVDTSAKFQPQSWTPGSALRMNLAEGVYGANIRIQGGELWAGEPGSRIAMIAWDGSDLVFSWTVKSATTQTKDALHSFSESSGRWEQLAAALVIRADGAVAPARFGAPKEVPLPLVGDGSRARLTFEVRSLNVAFEGVARQVTAGGGPGAIPVADRAGALGEVQLELEKSGTQVSAVWRFAPEADQSHLKGVLATHKAKLSRDRGELSKLGKDDNDRRNRLNQEIADAEQRTGELEAVLKDLPDRLAAATSTLRVECTPPDGLPWLVFFGAESKP